MIPVRYVGDLTEYDTFVGKLKEKLEGWIKKGYGYDKREKKTKEEILKYHDSLPEESRDLYLQAVGNGFTDRSQLERTCAEEELLYSPKSMFSVEGLKVLKELHTDFDRIVNARPGELIRIIEELDLDFTTEKSRRTALYEDLYRVFVTKGYNKLDKDSLWKATNVRVCPYCNRIYVGVVRTTKKTKDGRTITVKGQLDHFYPKERYPYLAVSKYNLVPSCTYCNGHSGKGERDPYKEGGVPYDAGKRHLVNPFSLTDHKGLRFKIESNPALVLNLKQFEKDGKIKVETTGTPDMAENCETFNLETLYNFHRDIAAETIFKHRAISSRAYVEFMKKFRKDVMKDTGVSVDIKDFLMLYWGVPLAEERLGERPFSKFILDLLNDLSDR